MSILDDISELNRRFETLFNEARQNEKTLKKFQNFEVKLMNSESAAEFFSALLDTCRVDFDWDQVTISLIDRDYGIRRLLNHTGDELDSNPDILFHDEPVSLESIYAGHLQPNLGPFDPARHDLLFPGDTEAPGSVALLPLMRKHELVGSFNIGCTEVERFNSESATDFLNHLSVVITVCLDNLLAREHLKYLGLIDNLTGVNNRRFFEQRLREETERVKRSGLPMSCLFVDVDHFKKINDTYGHPIGDQVLRHVAQIIREQVRTVDIVARYGGEEFTVILLQTGNSKTLEIAERIRATIERSPYLFGNDLRVKLTASIGINTLLPGDCGEDLKATSRQFVERADQALYAAKNSGRNCTVCYSDISTDISH